PPDPRRDLKPGVGKRPVVPPHNRPLPPPRDASLGKPVGSGATITSLQRVL
ncbi:hypothetical protein MTO96_045113, partial [Rhipicephalus appendiculatus]